MARTSDTRKRVFELADRIEKEGGTPSPTLIRELLGKGSPNTIVDALRMWRAAKGGPVAENKVHTASAVERLGLAELAELLRETSQLNAGLKDEFSSVANAGNAIMAAARTLQTLEATCRELADRLVDDRVWMQKELSQTNSRFESVQRLMMIAVDEAREETRKWKERAKAAKDEAATWQLTQGQRLNAQADTILSLRAKVEAYEALVERGILAK